MHTLVKQEGIDTALLLVELMAVEILDFYGIEWTTAQMKSMSTLFYNEYHYATLAELKLFAYRVKTGTFGKTYHKLSPKIIMDLASEFFAEQLEVRANFLMNQRDERPEIGDYVDPDKVSQVMKEFQAELEAKLAEEQEAENARIRRNDVKAYATLNNLNWEAIEKHFGFPKTKKAEE